MLKAKFLIWLFLFLGGVQFIYSQSFTYSGPTTVTVPFGSSTATATFYFSYSGLNNSKLMYPELIIALDGNVITSDLCSEPSNWLPSSYNISLATGTHTITFSLLSVDYESLDCYRPTIWKVYTTTVISNFQISVENIFGGGQINVDGANRTSPVYRTSAAGNNVAVEAIEQDYNGYHWIWNTNGTNNSEWRREPSGNAASTFSYSQNTSYSVQDNDINTKIIAALRKITNITFQNSFVGVGNGGTVIVNGTQYNSPTSSFQVVEQNPITAEARWLHLNGIEYSFSRWNDGNTSSTRTFYPNANTTYTAYFTGKPTNSGENVVAGGYDFGQPIVVTWTDNPNPAVNQFQIWRKVKQDGDIPTLLATVGRGIQTYTDDTYIATNGYTNDLVQYDVRAYYSTEGTYSDPAWTAVFGKKNIYNIYEDKPIVSLSNELPTEYSISNYPNPFNPSTTINYQLPQDGMVTIKVYDMLGREVATLVNENKPAGYYKVNFDASKLTSGVYIYTIRATAQAGQANNYVQSKKMLLMK